MYETLSTWAEDIFKSAQKALYWSTEATDSMGQISSIYSDPVIRHEAWSQLGKTKERPKVKPTTRILSLLSPTVRDMIKSHRSYKQYRRDQLEAEQQAGIGRNDKGQYK